jgi:hypothetical protein
MAFSLDPTLNAQWNALAGQTGDDVTAQRQLLASQNEAYQTNQNIQNMFNQGQTSPQSYSLDPAGIAKSSTNSGQTGLQYTDNYFSDPSDIAKFSTNSGQTGSTGFPTNPPPISPLVDTRNMLRDDVRYAPQGLYTSEGTPLIVGGANQVTSPLASMSSMQQPQGMIQGQAMSPDIQANFPPANTTYDPTKTIGDQIKALTSVADRQALLNNYEAYQTNQNVQNLYNLNQGNANTFLKDASAGLTPLATGQNPNTQTYTPDAFKAMTGFEQALAAGNNQPTLAGRQNSANALMQEFQGTGSNPLLGQYNVLPSPTGTQGSILPWQNGVYGIGTAGTPATTNITGTPASTTTTSSTTAVKTDPESLKSIYGITNPALLTYIKSNPKLSDVDLKNLSTAFNAKTPQEINDLQTSGNQPLDYQAQIELKNQAAEIQRKKDIANPNSWIYAKGLYDPTKDPKRQAMNLSQYTQDNQYLPLLNSNNTSPSASLNSLNDMYKNQLDVYTDAYGLKHVNTTNGIYTFDKTGKPIGFDLPSSDYRSQVQQTGTPNTLIDKYGNFVKSKT